MVTKIIDSDGEDVPAPSFTVYVDNGTYNKNTLDSHHYYDQVKECVQSENFSCIEHLGEIPEDVLHFHKYYIVNVDV